MVEKPIALTGPAAERLADLARQRNIPFAAAHVFLFARYLDNFWKLIRDAGRVDSLHLDWADPESEERYGERKRYDHGLPVFADWLPHVVSIVGSLVSRVPDNCRILEVRRGGAAVDLELMVGSIPCTVRMERNAERRRRIVQAFVQGQMFQLDSSREPGTINAGTWAMTGDQHWDCGMRPVARMLMAFLKWAAGGERDGRLDIEPGLRACKLIDDAWEMYRSAVVPWLKARLTAAEPGDEDLCYALAELLQAEGPLSSLELDRQIEIVRTRFSKTNGERWLEELIQARDAARVSYIVRGIRECGGC